MQVDRTSEWSHTYSGYCVVFENSHIELKSRLFKCTECKRSLGGKVSAFSKDLHAVRDASEANNKHFYTKLHKQLLDFYATIMERGECCDTNLLSGKRTSEHARLAACCPTSACSFLCSPGFLSLLVT